MYLRFTFNSNGDNFNAKECISNLNSNELNFIYDEDFPNYLSFIHPNNFSNEYWDEEYEMKYYSFLLKNIGVLKNYGANDFDLFIEVYIENSEQCNFQIINKEFLKIIGTYEIALPISIYNIS